MIKSKKNFFFLFLKKIIKKKIKSTKFKRDYKN